MKYYDTVVEEDPSYYKKVLHTGNLGHVISHINYSSFNMLYNSVRSLPVDTDESTSNYKTEEEEETMELEELIKVLTHLLTHSPTHSLTHSPSMRKIILNSHVYITSISQQYRIFLCLFFSSYCQSYSSRT
jgi:hypothetical protein